MGSIQNSLNQAIGTVGTAVAIGKHLKEEQEANTLSAVRGLKEANKEEADIVEEEGRNKEALQTVDKQMSKAEASIEGSMSSITDKRLRNSKGQFMQEKAFEEAEDKINLSRIQKQGLDARLNDLAARKEINAADKEFYQSKINKLKLNIGGTK